MSRQAKVNTAAGRLAFGSISGTYATLLALTTGNYRMLVIYNGTDKEMIVSLDGGTTAFAYIATGKELSLNFGAADLEFNGTIQVKDNGSAATSGAITVCAVRGT